MVVKKTNLNYISLKNLEFYSSDLGRNIKIIDYLKILLKTLWVEEEQFSGKRPLGNSGWQHDIFKCLVEHDIIAGKIDEDGYLQDCDEVLGNEMILTIIGGLE